VKEQKGAQKAIAALGEKMKAYKGAFRK
jgi:hypothetical protein